MVIGTMQEEVQKGAMSNLAASNASADLVGTLVGGYRVQSLVGLGAMGAVYRALAPDGDIVALKVIKPEHTTDEAFTKRFAREARIASSVQHPRVVPVLDVGQHAGMPYIATPFIEGGSLADRLAREVWLDVASTVRICAQVAGGLDALHEAGMIHRDVKPGNILLDRSGDAYITDFGLAKEGDGTLLTATGETLGSLQYMAPEQIRGDGVTAATDVYSLGCVAFECLAGRSPFAEREAVAILWAHLNAEPPETGRTGISPRFNAALATALEKDPAERPESCVRYAQMLAEAAGVAIDS
jgi:serine/threonine protein kinase